MTCKRCGSKDVVRSRRRGLRDRLQSIAGYWPYRCEECSYRFFTTHRYPPAPQDRPSHYAPGQEFRAYAGSAQQQEGPDLFCRTHAEKPQAQIVLQADSHEQLNDILIALNRAVNLHQSAHANSQAEAAGSRQ